MPGMPGITGGIMPGIIGRGGNPGGMPGMPGMGGGFPGGVPGGGSGATKVDDDEPSGIEEVD